MNLKDGNRKQGGAYPPRPKPRRLVRTPALSGRFVARFRRRAEAIIFDSGTKSLKSTALPNRKSITQERLEARARNEALKEQISGQQHIPLA